MTLTIRAHKGYDYRDDPHDRRGCHGLDLTFTTIGEHDGIRYAATLEVSTHWMARPLTDRYQRGADSQNRRDTPGLDAPFHSRDPSPSVRVCVPVGAQVPGYWAESDGPCPWLGVPCAGNTGYLVADDAFRMLLDGGEDQLEAWLYGCAESWLTPDPEETK